MQRFIEEALSEWKDKSSRRPIFLHGAKSCGKTHTVREFGQKFFKEDTVLIDCTEEEEPDLKRLFTQNQNLGGVLAAIEQQRGVRIDFTRTLLIIDNVHAFPAAIKAIKDVCDEKTDLFVVVIGDLTQNLLKLCPWLPFNFDIHKLYPLCFAEFLTALNRDSLAETVLASPSSLPSPVHDELICELNNYLLVGGMPEAVNCWLAEKQIGSVRKVQQKIVEKILNLKAEDLSPGEVLSSILRAIARNAGNQTDYATISGAVPQSAVKRTLDGLQDRGIVHRVYPTTPTSAPAVNFKVKKFKTIFVDVGLLSIVGDFANSLDANKSDSLGIFETAIYDQFLGQELLLSQGDQVQYWASSVKESSARVNYLIRSGGLAFPAVIKHEEMSLNDHALDMCLGSYPECDKARVFSTLPISKTQTGKIRDFPLYFALSSGGGYSTKRQSLKASSEAESAKPVWA